MAVKKFSLEAVVSLTDKMTKPIQGMEKTMLGFSKKMTKNFGGVGNDIKALDKGINKAAKGIAIGTIAIGAGAIMVGKSFIDAGAEVEKYKTTLTTMLGSVDLANKRFDEMSKFAASTPFELNEVVALGNQLQALGMYSKENMTLLGDLSAAAGKPIDQVTGAFAKLVSGQKGEAVNMFRDLLISTKDWTAATGKGIKKSGELMATTEEMIAALPKILAAKGFTGMMNNLSKTNEGITSNFKDTITRFKQGVGGILLPAWNKFLIVMTDVVSKFADTFNAQGARYVDMIAAGIESLADWISKIDIGKAIDQFIEFVKTVKAVIQFLSPLVPVILGLVVAVKLITFAMAAYNAVMWLVSLNPITLTIMAIVAVIAILVVGITALVKNWDKVVAAMKVVGSVIVGFFIDTWNRLIDVLSVVGGFFVNIGQTITKWLLLPINMALDAIGNLIGLLSKIPGMSEKLAPAMNAINGFQSGMNKTLTGEANAYDFGGVWNGNANPDTRVAESRTSTSSTSRSEVFVRADNGATVSDRRGGAPKFNLAYGAAQ